MIKVEVDGRRANRYLAQLVARGKRIPLRKLATIGIRSVHRNFQEQGRPVRWAPLKTLRDGTPSRSGMILQDKGRLKKSVDWEGFQAANNLKVYSDLIYAPPHQYGWPKRNIAARPFMMWQEEDIKQIQTVLLDHLTGVRRG